jgi:hypothetical protein
VFCTGYYFALAICLARLLLADKIRHMQSAVQTVFDVGELRARLRKMDDVKLCEFGEAARQMIAAKANSDRPPLDINVVQVAEATAEWRRRHPKNWQSESAKEL